MSNVTSVKRHSDDDYIAKEYSPELLRQIMHDYELSQGNDLPPAQEIFILDGEDMENPWNIDTSIIVIYSDKPDEC